ncbi:MAG: hypothetical protein QXN05_00090 [Acidilobaceae archaeon]
MSKKTRERPLVIVLSEGTLRAVNCEEAANICSSLRESNLMGPDYTLDKLEALYQLALGNSVYENEIGWNAVTKLLNKINVKLSVFLVYHDLRRKGRPVRTSPYPRSNLMLERSGKKIEILVLEAGSKVRLGDLVEWARLVQASNHTPVLAVVDELGVITYYEVLSSSALT